MTPPKGLTIEQAAALIEHCLEEEEAEHRGFMQAMGCGEVIGIDIPGVNEARGRLLSSGIPTAHLQEWIAKAQRGEAFPLLRVYDQFIRDIHTMAAARWAAEQSYPAHALLGQDCVERLRSESNSRNGRKPRNNKPAHRLSQSIGALAKECGEEGQRLSFPVLLDIFREDARCPSPETLLQALRNTDTVHIQIQEVDDQQERVYYRLTEGTEPNPVSFKRLRNLLSKISKDRKKFF